MADFQGLLAAVCQGRALSRPDAREAMDLLVSGTVPEAQAAAFLGALQARGARAEELMGFAQSLRAQAVTAEVRRRPLIDTCGTGGDGLHTFNISTAAALVAAGAGAAVAKHGNRAVSSRAGSADLLEAAGLAVDVPPARAARCVEETGFGFFFAPRCHPALRRLAPLRRALGVRTVFNLLGPLLNPADVRRQVVGIYDPALLETYAQVLAGLGAERVMVVHGAGGMDELSLSGPTRVCHWDAASGLRLETVQPEDAGLARAGAEALAGGDAAHNARLLAELLAGRPGPLLETVLFNAAAALLVAGSAADLKEGAALARQGVASGRAGQVLEAARRLSREP